LDLVCCTHPSFISSLVIGREFSDHCLECFNLDFNATQADKPRRKILMYNQGNFDKIRADMDQHSAAYFSNNPSQFSVDETWLQLKLHLHNSIDSNLPSKLSTSSKERPPWSFFTAFLP
jgi:hypothetical protein